MPRWVTLPLLFLAACATNGTQDRTALLSEAPPTFGACEVVDVPTTLPSAEDLVDSEALSRQVATLWEGQELQPGHVLLTLAYDEEGTNIRRDVIEHATTPTAADSVQKLVFGALEEMPEEEEQWTVRLRIDMDDDVRLRVGRSEYCAPRARDAEMEQAMRNIHFRGPRIERGVRTRTVIVRVTVDTAGRVRETYPRTGPPMGTRMRQDIQHYMQQFIFEPARLDGVPTYGTVDVPVRVRGI